MNVYVPHTLGRHSTATEQESNLSSKGKGGKQIEIGAQYFIFIFVCFFVMIFHDMHGRFILELSHIKDLAHRNIIVLSNHFAQDFSRSEGYQKPGPPNLTPFLLVWRTLFYQFLILT